MGEERRSEVRTAACFPAQVERGGETLVAMIIDVSLRGANLLTTFEYPVGETVKLHLYFSADPAKARAVEGRVVRLVPTAKDSEWTYRLGVEFLTPITGADDEIAKLAELQAKLFKLR
jgi:hypothetical protein